MSVLPGEIHIELVQLLDMLQSADNTVRTQAEDYLNNNWVATKPEKLLIGLVEHIQVLNNTTVSTPYFYIACKNHFGGGRY
jgi:hypothetical protein